MPQAAFATVLALAGGTVSLVNAGGAIRPAQGGELVYETESSDNYIQVVRDGNAYELSLNEGHATHSIYDPTQPLTQGPWDYFMVGPLFYPQTGPAELEKALLIGLAGGTVSKQLTAAYGPIPIDGVEIDGEIAEVGREWFDMTEPNLNVIVEDGRYVLRTSDEQYGLIGVDASVAAQEPGSLVRQVGESSIATGNIREVTEVTTVYTDDHAPVERVVDLIILGEARNEGEDQP